MQNILKDCVLQQEIQIRLKILHYYEVLIQYILHKIRTFTLSFLNTSANVALRNCFSVISFRCSDMTRHTAFSGAKSWEIIISNLISSIWKW